MNADQITGSLTFGLSCIDSNRCAFDDGTPYNSSSFNGFTGGQPNANLGGCVALETVGAGAGKWSNIPCTMYGSFVCRFEQNSSKHSNIFVTEYCIFQSLVGNLDATVCIY